MFPSSDFTSKGLQFLRPQDPGDDHQGSQQARPTAVVRPTAHERDGVPAGPVAKEPEDPDKGRDAAELRNDSVLLHACFKERDPDPGSQRHEPNVHFAVYFEPVEKQAHLGVGGGERLHQPRALQASLWLSPVPWPH